MIAPSYYCPTGYSLQDYNTCCPTNPMMKAPCRRAEIRDGSWGGIGPPDSGPCPAGTARPTNGYRCLPIPKVWREYVDPGSVDRDNASGGTSLLLIGGVALAALWVGSKLGGRKQP